VVKGPKDQAVSERLPVARIAVDISLAHLDRPFDYLVPASMDEAAGPGVRVRVRFAGQLVDGYLLERVQASEHPGRLARLERVISPEPVLTPEIFELARAVADRYAGTLADVLRLAIPPRHATAERETPPAPPAPDGRRPEGVSPDGRQAPGRTPPPPGCCTPPSASSSAGWSTGSAWPASTRASTS
jgi:primosomal protein N' (replication factor Y)